MRVLSRKNAVTKYYIEIEREKFSKILLLEVDYSCLTFWCIPAILFVFYWYGELSERFKEPVLKTGDSERNLGFESLTLRHNSYRN